MSEDLESINQLSKHHPRRDVVARQLRAARNFDRTIGKEKWSDDKSGMMYWTSFGGLEATTRYLRSLNGCTYHVLDVGAGSSRGISELINFPDLDGFDATATSLTHHPRVDNYLGKSRVKLTSAESLRGIEPNSISLILSFFSITYSVDPSLVARKFDEVLISGGVIKAIFAGDNNHPYGGKTSDNFAEGLRFLGYDVAVNKPRDFEGGTLPQTLLAVKPSANLKVTARQLIDKDFDLKLQSPISAGLP